MASVLAARPKKKKSKIDPGLETELNELGPPPSTSDLGELFETDVERPSGIYKKILVLYDGSLISDFVAAQCLLLLKYTSKIYFFLQGS